MIYRLWKFTLTFGRQNILLMKLDFLLSNPDEIKVLVKPMGYCIVSCKITDDEEPVGFMYREHTDEYEDSGWRFLSGTETDDYLEDEENSRVLDVNIVANLDPAVVPYVKSRFGSELERTINGDTITFE